MILCVCFMAYSDCETPGYMRLESIGVHKESLSDASAHSQRSKIEETDQDYLIKYQSVASVDNYAISTYETPSFGYYSVSAYIGLPIADGVELIIDRDNKGRYYYNDFVNDLTIAKTRVRVRKHDGDNPEMLVDRNEGHYTKIAYAEIWVYRRVDRQPIITYPDGTVSVYRNTYHYDHDTDSLYEEGDNLRWARRYEYNFDYLYEKVISVLLARK